MMTPNSITTNSLLKLLLLVLICFAIGFQYYDVFFITNIIQQQQRRDVNEEGQHHHHHMSPTTTSSSSTTTTTTVATAATTSSSSSSSSSSKDEFTVTFLGDIVFSNKPLRWPERKFNASWTMGESIDNLLPIRGDYIIGNLEGTITDAPISEDANGRGANYSFAMTPGVELILKNKLHLNAANQGNNHIGDRNIRGLEDTNRYLDSVGIEHFGAGLTPHDQAIPLTFTTPFGQKVGISSFHADTKAFWFRIYHDVDGHKLKHRRKVRTVLDPGNITHVQLAMEYQSKANTDIKIAFVHWGRNYVPLSDKVSKEYAPRLASAGYDMIIGSAGSHTVQPFDYVNGNVPVFYDIGNFVFEVPTHFRVQNKKYEPSLPYGSVAHVVFDSMGPVRLEIRCTLVDNDIVKCKPRYCNDDESMELFSSLGKYVNYTKGNTYATVDLRRSSFRGRGQKVNNSK